MGGISDYFRKTKVPSYQPARQALEKSAPKPKTVTAKSQESAQPQVKKKKQAGKRSQTNYTSPLGVSSSDKQGELGRKTLLGS